MNLGSMRSDLTFYLGFNDGQTNQDFSVSRLNWLLNWGYSREVRLAIQECGIEKFRKHIQVTWPSNQLTFVLPQDLDGNQLNDDMLISFIDETASVPGYEIVISKQQDFGGVFWLDNQTLQWGFVGPGADVKLGIEYVPQPGTMVNDTDTPSILPPLYHEVVIVSAAVLARTLADEAPPAEWRGHLREIRENMWSALSSARPLHGHMRMEEGIGEY